MGIPSDQVVLDGLAASEHRFDLLFERAPIGIALVGLDGRLLRVNHTLCDRVGYTPAALRARPFEDLLHPADRAAADAALHGLLAAERESYSAATRVIRKDHSALWMTLTIAPIRSSAREPASVLIFLHEAAATSEAPVTAPPVTQHPAETSPILASSLDYEETLTHLAQAVVPSLADWCCIVMVDQSGALRRLRVAHVDPVKQELVQELERRYPLDPLAPYGEPEVLRTGQPEVYAQVPTARLEATARDAGHLALLQRLGFVSSMIVPLVARGHTLGAITFIAADSGRQYGPADLLVAQDLADRAALAVDNAHLYQQAQLAVQVRDDFLIAASHDLRTPLTTLHGHAELVEMRLDSGRPLTAAWVRPHLKALRAAAARLATAVEQMTEVAHLQLGQALTLHPAPVPLGALTRAVARDVAAHWRRAGSVHVVIEPPVVVVPGDHAQLERVLRNLVDNALKYSAQGTAVTVSVRRQEDGASITVQDQGVGIPAADLPHIGTRFYRAATAAGRPGWGVGLAGATRIVEQHGGQLRVESTVGVGTTVTVWLPVARMASARDERGAP